MKKFTIWLIKNLHFIIALFLLAYTIVPFLSPVFFKLGYNKAGQSIQNVYQYLCHQRPERSLFLFGRKMTYSSDELEDAGYKTAVLGHSFIGNEEMGYKVAFCVRDTFIYSTMSIVGLIICFIPNKIKAKWWMVLLMALPMMIDGTTQFISEFLFLAQDKLNLVLEKPFYLSNNLNRAITGALFGLAVALIIFPELKEVTKDDENNKESKA
ncbi:DUF2085 domain-containing protein [Candidatus Dojkabacteria bacterium]|nr:DUF2085 domain-containing protein [Candidatus Dojkabacteria bacterium]